MSLSLSWGKVEFPAFVQIANDVITDRNRVRRKNRKQLLEYHDAENPSVRLIKQYEDYVVFETSAPELAGSANTSDLISAGSRISRPIGSDEEWNDMIHGDGFYGPSTNIMAHINSYHMTLEEELRFNNAAEQLMLAINKTTFVSQYYVSNSRLQGNLIYHFVESMLANAYPHDDSWHNMNLSVLKSLPDIKDLKDRYALLIEYLPYTA